MPYQSAAERMDRLETVLNSFIQESRATIAEIRLDIAEMRQWRVQSQKQWGEITQKMGTFVEDIVASNIPRLGRDTFALGREEELLFSGPRLRLRHPNESARIREFDYIYAAKRGGIVVESRNSPKLNDSDQLRELLADASEYFPQSAAFPLRPIFAASTCPSTWSNIARATASTRWAWDLRPCHS